MVISCLGRAGVDRCTADCVVASKPVVRLLAGFLGRRGRRRVIDMTTSQDNNEVLGGEKFGLYLVSVVTTRLFSTALHPAAFMATQLAGSGSS